MTTIKLISISFILSVTSIIWALAPALAQEEIRPSGRRIVGGEKTDIKEHPWQVALDIKIDGRTYLCGGSIIANGWVLTAAHCFKRSTKPNEVSVKAGATNYIETGSWVDAKQVVIHEEYDPNTHANDLALVKLGDQHQGRVISMETFAQKIPVGQQLEVTGWGASSEGGNASRVLMKAVVPFTDNTACNEPNAYNGIIKDGMMCAGSRDGGVDSCQGDSGGPLVWRTPNGPVLVGVVSWGEGCARKLRYGVYTRVENYQTWIYKALFQREPDLLKGMPRIRAGCPDGQHWEPGRGCVDD